jgi:hypothetical protein
VSNSRRRICFDYIIASVLPKKCNAFIKAPMLVVKYIWRVAADSSFAFWSDFLHLALINKLLRGVPN